MSNFIHFGAIFVLSLMYTSIQSEPQRIKFSDVARNVTNKTFTIERKVSDDSKNRVLVAVVVRDQAYALPTFLATLEAIKCPNPNQKCHLWVIFDNCTDKSFDIFTFWLSNTRTLFDTIIMLDTKNDLKTKEKHPELDEAYFSHNLKLRALKFAKDREFTHIFYLNADIIITNPDTIEILMNKKKTILAPLLTSGESQHSTYWVKKEEISNENKLYDSIYNREQIGCFKVIGVQECYLIDLYDKAVDQLFKTDDFFVGTNNDDELSYKSRYFDIIMYVCNRVEFGLIPDKTKSVSNDPYENFIHLRMEYLLKGPNKTYNQPLKTTQFLDKAQSKKRKTKLGFDQIYVINLQRRNDRRERIEAALNDLNLSFNMTKAVDSKLINEEYLKSLNISVIPNYLDPYHDRPINYGEIACFLSHYNIWKDMIDKKYEKIIILEDDAKFASSFKSTLVYLINEMKEKSVEWELLYLGRKLMKDHSNLEKWNTNVNFRHGYGIRIPNFSHWTISYALSLNGAKKLVEQEPLSKILPIDEYLPIMFDKQPNEYWKSFYPNRNLITYAVQPTIVMPTHFFGEPNYVSDTEQTPTLDKQFEMKLDQHSDFKLEEPILTTTSNTNSHIEL